MTNSQFHSRKRGVIPISCAVVLVCVGISPPLNAQSLPSPWVAGDVGTPVAQGSVVFSDDTFRVTAAGGEIGSQADRFTFVQRRLTGDGVIVAHLRPANGDALAKAGLMIRESLDPQSAHVFALSTGSGIVRFERRRVEGGGTTRTNTRSTAAPWLKVERHGATFTAFRSSDGATWREIGTDIIPMADTVLVGLAVTSGTSPTATTDFSTVSVTGTAAVAANAASRGGVMIRDSLTPNGAHASMFMTADNGPAFVQRAAAGGIATITPSGTAGAPYWLKLELRADTVTAFQS